MTGSRPRALPALLVAEALLVMAPTLAVAQLWQGAWTVGAASRLRLPDAVLQGVGHVAGPLLVVLLLVAAGFVRAASRAWAVVALVAQLPVAAHVVVPLLRPYTTLGRLPGGAAVLLGVVVATTVASVVLLVRSGSGVGPGRRRVLGATAVVVVVLAVVGVGIASGLTRPGLPTYPWEPVLSAGSGDGGGAPVPAAPVPQQPGLAPDPFNSLHNDGWATDAYAIAGPRDPRSGAVESLFTGGDCATITFDSRGRLVTVCSSLRRVTAFVVDRATLAVLASAQVGERTGGLTDFTGGGYFFLDDRDRIVLPTTAGAISVVAVRETGGDVALVPERGISVADRLQPGERVTSVMPDSRARYWFVGSSGTVGLADPATGAVSALNLDAEGIGNSFAVTGGTAYVVTDAALYRLDAEADGVPRVVWREPYDRGERRKPGQTGIGSGTTPTVLAGGALVAITDNAGPRMQVVVMRTAASVPRRVVCRVPVFEADASATENSLIAVDGGLVVENNFGYDPPVTATAGGATTVPGVAMVDVTVDGCATRWTNLDVSVPSVVSKASAPDGAVLTYSKPPSWWGGDGWYLTALDLRDGHVLWSRLAGGGLPYNNHYAGVALSPDGDLWVGTVNGLAVLRAGTR